MEYREFGQTGLKVSAIGFGCWELGGGYGSIDDAEVVAAVNRAIDLGINCFLIRLRDMAVVRLSGCLHGHWDPGVKM